MPGPEKFNHNQSPTPEKDVESGDIIETEAEYRARLQREKKEARDREIEDSSKRRQEQQKIKPPDKPPESESPALARPLRVVPRKKKIGPQLRRPIIKKDQIEMVEPVIIEVDRNSAKDKKGK